MELNIKPYCTCISNGKWKPQDGWKHDYDSNLWVHSRCHKPSRMNYDRLIAKRPQIPEVRDMGFMRGEIDIWEHELKLEARKEIEKELGWDEDDD